MIYLQFPENKEDNVKEAYNSKPYYYNKLIKLFEESYSFNLACKYSLKLANFIFEKMEFPTGIVYMNSKTKTFFKYSEEDRKWEDTKKSKEDYVITENSSLWETFFEENSYYKELEGEIKKVIKEETSKMILTPEIEAEPYRYLNINMEEEKEELSYTFIKGLDEHKKKILCEYFSEKITEKVYSRIEKAMFKKEDTLNYIVIFEQEKLKGILNEEKFEAISEENFKGIYEEFKNQLEEQDLKEFVAQIRNQFLYKCGNIKYPIKSQDEENWYTDPIKDLTISVDEKGLYTKLNKKIMTEVIRVLSSKIKQDRYENKFKFEFDDEIAKISKENQLQVYCSEYNISLLFRCDSEEMTHKSETKILSACLETIYLGMEHDELVLYNIDIDNIDEYNYCVKIKMGM